MGRLQLILDEDKKLYTSDDVVSGRVVANFSKPMNVREIVVRLRCRTLVELIFFFSGVWEHPAAEELNFQIEARLFPPPELVAQEIFTFPKGRHEWPFAFPLVNVAPLLIPTCRGRNETTSESNCFFSIFCDLTATLRRKSRWKNELTTALSINLMTTTDRFAIEAAMALPTFGKFTFTKTELDQSKFKAFKRKIYKGISVEVGALVPPLIAPTPRQSELQLQFSSSEPLRIESVAVTLVQKIDVRLSDCSFEGHATSFFGRTCKKVDVVSSELDLSKFVSGFKFDSNLPSFNSNLIRCRHSLVFDVFLTDLERLSTPQVLQLQVPVEAASAYEAHCAPTYAEATSAVVASM